MSSAMNHKKRSRYSEQIKGGALGILGRMFHRRAPKHVNTIKEG